MKWGDPGVSWEEAEKHFPGSSVARDIQFGDRFRNHTVNFDNNETPTKLHLTDPMCGYEIGCCCFHWNPELQEWVADWPPPKKNRKNKR